MRKLVPLLLVALLASAAPAQSLFLDKGEAGSLLMGGYSHSEGTDGALAYYGISLEGEVDLAVQFNRVWTAADRVSNGVTTGVELFAADLSRGRGTLQLAVAVAAEFGKITGGEHDSLYAPGHPVIQMEDSTYRSLMGTARLYGRLDPEREVYFYFGISYIDLEIKTEYEDWTQTLSGSSQPVHAGLAGARGRWVASAQVDRDSGITAWTLTVGRLL